MTARTVTIGAPFGWLMKALDVGRRNPKALFGGFLLMLVVGLVPSLVQIAGDRLATPLSGLWFAVYAAAVVISLVLMPPLLGAAFRLVHRCETGVPVRATDIFDGYRLPGFWQRMVLLSLAFLALYVVAFAVLYSVLPGRDLLVEFFRRALATPPGGQPDLTGLGAPPGGLFFWLLGAMVLLLVLGNAYLLAFARAALDDRGVVAALGDGFRGAFANFLPFLAFALAAMFVGFVLMLIAGIVIGLLVVVLSLVSPVLGAAAAIVLYLALMLGLYVVLFGFYYHAWRAIFAPPGAPAAVDPGLLAA